MLEAFRDWIDQFRLRHLLGILYRKFAIRRRGANIGPRFQGGQRPTETAVELGAEAYVVNLAERRRDRAHRDIKPLADSLSASRFPEQERNYDSLLCEQGGELERALAEAHGKLLQRDEDRRAAKAELSRFAAASDCSENEDFSRDGRSLIMGGCAFTIVEAAAGGGVFGDVTPGGVLEAMAVGTAIGMTNVLSGCLCAMLRQASWGRPMPVRLAAVGFPVAGAAFLTLTAAHYRLALSAGAADPLAAAIATLFASPLAPLGSLTVAILAVVGAYAFVHMMRAWLKVYGRVPGHRERGIAVLRAQDAFEMARDAARAVLVAITEAAKAQAKTLLALANKRRITAEAAVTGICSIAARYAGEVEAMTKALAAANCGFAEAAAGGSGRVWTPRSVPENWYPPLAAEDPRPILVEINAYRKTLETAFARAVQTMERAGAAAIQHLGLMATAIRQGRDIGPDLPPKGGGAGPNGRDPGGLLGRKG